MFNKWRMKAQNISTTTLIAALTLLLPYHHAIAHTTNTEQNIDKIVAIVNSDVITNSTLDKKVTQTKAQLASTETPLPSDDILRQQVLTRMVDEKIELQMAEKLGITATPEAVDASIRDIANRNNITLAELRNNVTKAAMSYADYKNTIKEQIILHQLMQREIAPRVFISKQDVDNIINSENYAKEQQKLIQYHLEDILIALPEVPSSTQLQQAKKQADHIVSQLHKGANFQKIAIAQSNGTQALKGGDLGWRSLEALPSVFASKVTSMKKGDVAGPIRAPNGYHIVKLEGIKNTNNEHYITKSHVRHILIKTDALNDDDTVQKRLTKLTQEVKNGVPFNNLAEKYSQDPASAAKGGDLGWVTPGILVPPFEKAMDKLAINQVSTPVKTQYGWHIIEVLGREKVDNTQEYREDQIRKMLFTRKFEDKEQEWINRMRETSYIKILLPKVNITEST